MRYTYDLNTNGCLILYASNEDRHAIAELIRAEGTTYRAEWDALESLICNSELDWIDPAETGDLTDAPMLGFRKPERKVRKGEKPFRITSSDGKATYWEPVEARWAYMDYQVRSFLEDLRDKGKAVFVS
jgi:hypothetical protein